MPKRTTLPNVTDLMEVTTQEIQGIPTDTTKLILQMQGQRLFLLMEQKTISLEQMCSGS